MVPSDTGIRGLSGDRPVFIVPGRLLPIADNRREAGREFSAGLVSSHDVLVRVVVRPRHRVTPQQQPPPPYTAIARDQDRARPECRFIAISLSIQLITLN